MLSAVFFMLAVLLESISNILRLFELREPHRALSPPFWAGVRVGYPFKCFSNFLNSSLVDHSGKTLLRSGSFFYFEVQ